MDRLRRQVEDLTSRLRKSEIENGQLKDEVQHLRGLVSEENWKQRPSWHKVGFLFPDAVEATAGLTRLKEYTADAYRNFKGGEREAVARRPYGSESHLAEWQMSSGGESDFDECGSAALSPAREPDSDGEGESALTSTCPHSHPPIRPSSAR